MTMEYSPCANPEYSGRDKNRNLDLSTEFLTGVVPREIDLTVGGSVTHAVDNEWVVIIVYGFNRVLRREPMSEYAGARENGTWVNMGSPERVATYPLICI